MSSGATSITLASDANLPTLTSGQIFVFTLNDEATGLVFEVIYCTTITGAVLSGCTRGREGTTAVAWIVGDYAFGAVTAGVLNSYLQSGNEPGSGYAVLSPASQQTGSLNVSGEITSGTGVAVGGALSAATNGVFSGNVSAGGTVSATTISGTTVEGTTGSFTGDIGANGDITAAGSVNASVVVGAPSATFTTQVNIGSAGQTAIAPTSATFGGSASFGGQVSVVPNDGSATPAHVISLKTLTGVDAGVNTREYYGNAAITVSAAAEAGILVGSLVLTWPDAFASSASYSCVGTAQNGGLGAMAVVTSSKSDTAIALNLYSIQVTTSGTVYVDWTATGS